ncbi:site-specific DNA-methyltransferase [Nonomuraea sp. NPDC050663]|uniref:site-specific DNA-methyltransferase n=1 Tax=Nonomuraea sp. NPDC050663 TaxID=3364370 RepID=UPI0037A38778
MAHIDNLIATIKDPQLRDALRAEYEKINKTRRFGLVFDRHQPETIVLPVFPVRIGDKVQALAGDAKDRTAVDGTGIWTVISIGREEGKARLRDNDGNTRNEQLDRLVVTREFGDPIYPGLKSTDVIIRGGGVEGDPGGKPFHSVINGENYHALQALLFPYEGLVDAIYIDPPYNTGARDWKYNNNYVDEADPYRHSKWLSFMEKRLQLAKRLLNPVRSVLIVTIDEKEVHRLTLLLEQLFPSSKIQVVTSVMSSKGVIRAREFSRVDEYIITVLIGDESVTPWDKSMLEGGTLRGKKSSAVEWLPLRRREPSSTRASRPNQFYPIFVRKSDGSLYSIGDSLGVRDDRHSVVVPVGTIAVWPLKPSGEEMVWGVRPESLRRLWDKGFARLRNWNPQKQTISVQYLPAGTVANIEEGQIRTLGYDEDGSVQAERVEDKAVMPKTVWNMDSHNAENYGTLLLKKLIPGHRFPYPKSLYAVEDALRFFVRSKPDALILDFFGGSGTTLHAVARLNRQDGGQRRCIIVTNNEVSAAEAVQLRTEGLNPGDAEWEALGICALVTIPRIRAAITGMTSEGDQIEGSYKFSDPFPMSEGFPENVEFFDLTYEDPALVSLGRRFAAIAPLLWLMAGAKGARVDRIDPSGWALPEDSAYGVLFDTSTWPGFIRTAANRSRFAVPLTHVFVVTDSIVEFQQIAGRLDQSLSIKRLYADYLSSFEINNSQ